VLGGACDSAADHEIENVFDPCTLVVLLPAGDTTADERRAIEQAIALWDVVGTTQVVVGGDTGGARLAVRFEDAAPLFHGIYLDEDGAIVINRRLSGGQRQVTLAHELGHAFGLHHIDTRSSVMNPGNLERVPDRRDALALAHLWGQCGDAADAPVDRSPPQ
jgi:hypothetical protein